MAKKGTILLFMILFFISLSAQNWNEIYYLENEAEYLLEEKNFEKAIEMYQKILKEIPDNSFIKFKIGLVYLETDNQKEKAITILEEIVADVSPDFNSRDIRETRAPLEGYLYLGLAYHKNNRLDDAKKMYMRYKESISSDHYNYPLVNQYIESCNNAQKMISNPERLQTNNLGDKINDDNSNFNAVFSGDGNTMIYTSYTKNYIDIFQSKKNGDRWSSPKNITNQVSKKYYLKTSSLSYQGDELYLATDDPDDNDIFVSYLEGRQWTNADKLHKTISHRKSNETHASLSPDGNTIYFTSDRDGGFGGLDIYKSTRNEKGKWSDAENLGPKINTPFNEETPFVSSDGKYLFFSSEGHNSMGGYDVFYINLSNPDKVINRGYPVNTTSDDLFFVPGDSLSSGYMARVEDDSKGRKDIYKINILPDIFLHGEIFNLADGGIIENKDVKIILTDKEQETIAQSQEVNKGNFSIKTSPGSYKILITNDDFETYEKEIVIPDDYDKELFALNIELQPKIAEKDLVAEEITDSAKTGEVTDYLAMEEPKTEEEPIKHSEVAKEEKTEEPVKQPEPRTEKELAEREQIVSEASVSPSSDVLTDNKSLANEPKTNLPAGSKTFSVQLMALKTPVKLSYFKDIKNITLTKSPDGFYRYTVGLSNSYEKAQKLQLDIHKLGYKDAFIKKTNFSANYTIQLMALIIPVDLTYFKNLPMVSVSKGLDDFYRYTTGYYGSYREAEEALNNFNKIGYNGAFIKRINKDNKLMVEK